MKRKLPIFCSVLLIFAVLALSSPAQAVSAVGEDPVPIDIRPDNCPNYLNLDSAGNLVVVIAGTPEHTFARSKQYHTVKIDVDINGIEPFQWRIEDVVTPYYPNLIGVLDPNDCRVTGPDDILDLVLHFDASEIAGTLDDVQNGDVIALMVTGLINEIEIYDGDILVISSPAPQQAAPESAAKRSPHSVQGPQQGSNQRQRAGAKP